MHTFVKPSQVVEGSECILFVADIENSEFDEDRQIVMGRVLEKHDDYLLVENYRRTANDNASKANTPGLAGHSPRHYKFSRICAIQLISPLTI